MDKLVLKHGFKKYKCEILNYNTNPPTKKKHDGKSILIWVYIHADASGIKIKPNGDPSSLYRKKPDASKAFLSAEIFKNDRCRYYDFSIFKIDNKGMAIPKSPKDMYNPYDNTERSGVFIKGWSDRAHTYLKLR